MISIDDLASTDPSCERPGDVSTGRRFGASTGIGKGAPVKTATINRKAALVFGLLLVGSQVYGCGLSGDGGDEGGGSDWEPSGSSRGSSGGSSDSVPSCVCCGCESASGSLNTSYNPCSSGRVCAVMLSTGMACAPDDWLDSDFECRGSCDPPTCPGDDNPTGNNGAPCRQDLECGDGLVCNDYYDECRRPSETGERCDGDDDCSDGYYCHRFSGEEPSLHDRCYSGQQGEPCSHREDPCANGLICHTAPPGQTDSNDIHYPDECWPLSNQGEPCFHDSECTSGLICNTWFSECSARALPLCRSPGGRGDVCWSSEDCDGSLTCTYEAPSVADCEDRLCE